MASTVRIGILGASGYTGADSIRLAVRHPDIEIAALTANTHAGKPVAQVFPHLGGLDLPDMVQWQDVDWSGIDAVLCGLPHGTTQEVTAAVLASGPAIKVIDMSADFRLRDTALYAATYGGAHRAPELQKQAVYGLTEHNRAAISATRLVACPGCYPTAVLLALLPVVAAGQVDAGDLVIDAKSGVSGAGRGLKQNMLFCEAGEGMAPYAVGTHRHAPEIEQEISKIAGRDVTVSFTPHLVPMSRGELCTCHVRLADGAGVADLRETLNTAYAAEPFVQVLAEGAIPATQYVRGSNRAQIGVFADRISGRAIVIVAIDNLVKGSAGQAIQNLNVVFGIEETTGLEQVALFP